MKTKREIIHLDELISICGHFTSDTTVNNCYGCTHPEQEETDTDDETGKEMGKCYSFSCPIAPVADLEDMKKLDTGLYNDYKDEDFGPELSGADYMVIESSLKDG